MNVCQSLGLLFAPALLFAGDCTTEIHPKADALEGFPVSPTVLQHLIDSKDMPGLRAHAWQVFSQMTRESHKNPGLPIWRTWYPAAQVYSKNFRTSDRFTAYPLNDRLPPNEPTPIEILYNPPACAAIRSQSLHVAETLDALPKSTKITLPGDSLTIKAVWEFVHPDKCLELPVWNFRGTKDRRVDPEARFLEVYWPDSIEVCSSPSASHVQRNGRVIPEFPLSRFYNHRLSADEQSQIDRLWSKTNNRADGDTAILLGIHFATRELENWFWATLWWHPSAGDWPYGHDRPARAFGDPRWSNYLLDVSVDMDWPFEGNASPNAVYNPYLELNKLEFGTRSNCMTCHARAFWGSGNVRPGLIRCISELTGKQVAFTAVTSEGSPTWSSCNEAETATGTPLPTFDLMSELRTSFLWSLAFRPIPRSPK